MPLDLRLLGFTAGLAVLTCVLFGLLPAAPGVADGSDRGAQVGRPRHRRQRRAALRPPGARRFAGRAVARAPRRRAALRPQPAQPRRRSTPGSGATTSSSSARTTRACACRASAGPRSSASSLERMRAIPGVAGAANARIVPLGGDCWNEHISVEGTDVRRTSANFNRVGPGYFRTMGTTLLAGRDFDGRDDARLRAGRDRHARRSPASSSPAGTRSAATFQVDNQGGDTVQRFQIVGLVARHQVRRAARGLHADRLPRPHAQDARPRPWTSIVVRRSCRSRRCCRR